MEVELYVFIPIGMALKPVVHLETRVFEINGISLHFLRCEGRFGSAEKVIFSFVVSDTELEEFDTFIAIGFILNSHILIFGGGGCNLATTKGGFYCWGI
jgi:hypothetical protein